jgi:RNA polymerase sigma-70 factor, ECF subfamily
MRSGDSLAEIAASGTEGARESSNLPMNVVSGASRAETVSQGARFEDIVQPLLANAFGLAYSMLGDRAAAEDAVQEAATKAWRSLDRLRQVAAPQSWFFAIVANQCRDARRAWRRVATSLDDVPQPIVADHADQVAQDLDLARALDRLSPQQRGLLYLRYHLDLPPSQIAEVLHWRVGTVKSRLHRTLRSLAREVADQQQEESR